MRAGIVAEGRGDLGVLTRILKGALGLDLDQIEFLRPEFDVDETDTFAMGAAQRSNWARVIDECRDRRRVREFFEAPTDEVRVLIVQIDAAECGLAGFDVARPSPADVERLCERIERTMLGWMEGQYADRTCFAVAVEETEAWVLPLYLDAADTCAFTDPKARLNRALNRSNVLSERDRKKLFMRGEFELMREVAKALAKRTTLDAAATRNLSLRRLVDALDGVRGVDAPDGGLSP
jgi:hypothetical protein